MTSVTGFKGFLVLFGLCFTGIAAAYDNGQQLAQAAYDRPDGDSVYVEGVMALEEKGHEPRIRQLYSFRQDLKNGDVATLIRFKLPKDITDTGLLTINPSDGGDANQWIYLPAVDKSRRIASDRKGGRFVASEIFYEDLRDRKVNKDKHTILKKEKMSGQDTIVLESVPVSKSSSVYDKRISWIEPKSLIALRVDLYQDGSKEPTKRMLVTKIEKKQGFWTGMKTVTEDLKTGNKTIMQISKIQYDVKLPQEMFSQQYLEDPTREVSVVKGF